MIASNLACFIKQTISFLQRKMIQASHSAMSIDIYHLSKEGCCSYKSNKYFHINKNDTAYNALALALANSPAARAQSSFAQPQSKCLLLFFLYEDL
jgi:hypothetical protein